MTGLRGPLFVALLLRVVLLVVLNQNDLQDQVLTPDSSSYLVPARHLAAGQGFTNRGQAELSRTPGYPLLLVPGHWLGQPVRWALAVQVMLSLLLVLGTARLVRGLGHSELSARVAAWLVACEPLLLLYSAQVLTETLFTTMFVWMLAFRVEGRIRIAVLLGACLPLVRPIGLVLAPLCALIELWRRGPESASKAAYWFVPWLICFGAWTIRNSTHGVSEFSTIGTGTLFNYYAAGVEADATDRPFLETRDALRAEIPSGARSVQVAFMHNRSWEIIRAHPGIFFRHWLRGWLRTVADPEASSWARLFGSHSGGWLTRSHEIGVIGLLQELRRNRPEIFCVYGLLGALLAVLGLAACLGIRRGGVPPLIWVLGAALFMLSGGINAHGRFRHPLMPLIIVCAAPVLTGLKRNET